jgi:hypothetical protein
VWKVRLFLWYNTDVPTWENHVCDVVGRSAKLLKLLAERLDEVGLGADARAARLCEKELRQLVYDTMTKTQPIEIDPKEK